MAAARSAVQVDSQSANSLSHQQGVEAALLPPTVIEVTVSGSGVKEPAIPATEASAGENAADLQRMMLSEVEAIAGHKKPFTEYAVERERRRTGRSSQVAGNRVPSRGDRKRTS